MKKQNFNLVRYDADDGMVFDWREPRYTDVVDEQGKPTGEQVQEHLYAKTLFIGGIGGTDNIENYIEVKMPEEVI